MMTSDKPESSVCSSQLQEHTAQVIHRNTTSNMEFIALLDSFALNFITKYKGTNLLNLPSPKKTKSISTFWFPSLFQTKTPYYKILAMLFYGHAPFPFFMQKELIILSCFNN